jgi:prepilin-type N-terminal cleavage/methylation domain-containing protein
MPPRIVPHKDSRPIGGFTLIELMMVIVIIGLLAAISGPQLSAVRERTVVAVMVSDLRNFATAEESYFYDFSTYSSDPAQVATHGFQTSANVSVAVNEATASGWSATASDQQTPRQCYIYLGTAAPVGSAHSEGMVACS